MRMFVVVAVYVLFAACGSSPTTPTPVATPPPVPQYPAVAGTYSGTIVISLPELNTSVTCPAQTVVTQSGASVNIAPIQLTPACNSLALPLGSVTIDTTGAILGPGLSGNYFEPACGGTYAYTASGGFFGRELRIAFNATSAVCYNLNFSAVLSR